MHSGLLALVKTWHCLRLLLLLIVVCRLLPGAYYVEKRYTEAADAYSKSLAIFDMIDDVSCLLDGVEQPGASHNCGGSCSGICCGGRTIET
jgi:hypothetical protein